MPKKTDNLIKEKEVVSLPKTKSTKAVKTTKSTVSTKTAKVDKTATKKNTKTTKPKPSKKDTVDKTKTIEKNKIITSTATNLETINVENLEYYDLPYRYNETIVTLLAQSPNRLFVYWDISDDDRENYIKEYGEDFFNITEPILYVHNETMNYTFKVNINDFANSWYIPINDDNCKYKIELGRIFKPDSRTLNNTDTSGDNKHSNKNEEYIYVATSNNMDAPNGSPLLNNLQTSNICFKNIKTNAVFNKTLIKNDYKKLYSHFFKEEFLAVTNPSSR